MRFSILCLTAVFLFSCADTKQQKAREFTRIQQELVHTDSIDVRAVVPISDSSVWFAANHGKIGFIDGKTPKLATVHYEGALLAFRSIAKTKDAVFILSVASPAVLYKIGFDGSDAAYIDDVYMEEGENVFYNAMKFWNDKEGVAMGDPVEDCLSVIITRNGGNTWSKLPCDVLPKTEEGEGAFAASNSNIAIYKDHTWIVTGGKRSRIFYSPDKGKSWEVFDTPIQEGDTMTGIYSVDFYDEKTGVIFGGDWNHKASNTANKAITKDGGKTWTLLNDGRNPGYTSSVKFVPGSKGQGITAVGDFGISYSGNQGRTWRELSKEGFHAIEFVNDSVAFASGKEKIVRILFQE